MEAVTNIRDLFLRILGIVAGVGVVKTLARRLSEQAELSNGIPEKELELKAAVEKQELGVRLKSLINNVPGIVYQGHRDWSISLIGAEVESVTGYTPDSFTSGAAGWKEIIYPDDLEQVKETFRRAEKEKTDTLRVEYRIRHKDGGIRWIADRRQMIYDAEGNFARVDGLLLDITEQKKAEEQIRWNYHTQQALTSILQISLKRLTLREKLEWALDVLFHVPWLQIETKGCFFLVGKEPETLEMEAHRGLPPEMLSACGKIRIGECLCGKAAVTRQILFTAGGDEAHTHFPDDSHTHGHYCVPILSGETLLGVLNMYVKAGHRGNRQEIEFLMAVGGILAGFVELEHAGEELRRLETAVRQAGEIMMITDIRGDIQYVNPAFEKVTGYTCAEVIGKNPRILNSGEQDAAFYKEMWSALLRDGTWNGRFTNRRKDGKLYQQETSIYTVYDASGNVVNYVGVMRDNTRERLLEEQLRQSQKMEAIGALTGGVAHDFNNMLTVIDGYSDILLHRLGEGNPLAAEVKEIRKASDSASSLTRQLLAFSRMQVFQSKVVDLNDLVANMRNMLCPLIGENIELVTKLGENLWRVKADPGQIQQVLMNLVVNARDAIQGRGRISIETSNTFMDKSFERRQADLRLGPYVLLSVTDTGMGMDKETMSRIFEPFFTTKEKGKGTGLGLATVYGIVKQSKGYIWTYSEPGHGTTFKIHLPKVDEQLERKAQPPQIPSRSRGGETILVVEDTDLVRSLVLEVLTMLGYKVLEASDGKEALLLCERFPEPIHLLLTDMMMPGMSGPELAGAIASIRPDIGVLYMSGYTEYGSTDNAGLPADAFFIQKPFSTGDMAKKVREVLDKA